MGDLVQLHDRGQRPLTPASSALEAGMSQTFLARHASANHAAGTIAADKREVVRFRAFTGRPPWEWEARDVSAYRAACCATDSPSTVARKQGSIRRFLDHCRHPGYRLDEQCFALTGRHVPQICTPENTIRRRDGAATSKRRSLTRDELMRLLATIVVHMHASRRRRDYLARATYLAVISLILAFGLRLSENALADRADLAPAVTPEIAAYSPYEDFTVRFGKSSNGQGPKRRTVPALYRFKDSLAAVDWYLRTIRPELERPESPDALFLNTKGQRLRADSISHACKMYLRMAALSEDLSTHCLRHSFVTLLREDGLPSTIVARLVGHEDHSTTAIYDHMGEDFVKEQLLDYQAALIRSTEAHRSKRRAPGNRQRTA